MPSGSADAADETMAAADAADETIAAEVGTGGYDGE